MGVADPVRQASCALRCSQPFGIMCRVSTQAEVSIHGLQTASSKSKNFRGRFQVLIGHRSNFSLGQLTGRTLSRPRSLCSHCCATLLHCLGCNSCLWLASGPVLLSVTYPVFCSSTRCWFTKAGPAPVWTVKCRLTHARLIVSVVQLREWRSVPDARSR